MSNTPATKFRDGTLQVTVWRNTGDKGTYYSVNPSRSYRQGDDAWKETDSLNADDLLAMGVLAAAARSGLAVPGDVSVTGYDDIAYAAFTSPPLTTVRQPARAMGEEAARLLLARLEGDESPPRRAVVEPELVVRASTGPPRGGAG